MPDDPIARIREAVPRCMAADRPRLLERLRTLERRSGPLQAQALARLAERAAASEARRARRQADLPVPTFPEHLPVAERREEIARAIAAHPVVVVAGETGSGKTTQLPKICLGLSRGVDGKIGHTQPRRIAARSLAERIASELETPLGHAVGFKVRFSDHTSPDTYVKVMTDGILLAETRGDPLLAAYDTLIVDEAHERSLNIDFLLGYLTRLLPKRPDLKVIVTSATIDTARFARHFGAPVVEVSGRTYPVEVRYRPPSQGPEKAGRDPHQGLLDAVDELTALGPEGDILAFFPGEREIREAAEALRKHHPHGTEILPLFARLSASEQGRVFRPGPARRIVLATNVAETSLTVPRVRYVIDTGLARISRYSTRAKVQRLPVEAVSRASADQRAGRCGRLSDGVCIRLYSEADFAARPAFTEPEVRRTNLAAVILRMLDLNLGAPEDYPFVDPPERRQIADGMALLAELGAVDGTGAITPLGHELCAFQIDPRLARMVLAAKAEGALREVLVIAAALSIRDPRDRPLEFRTEADRAHARFADLNSDFVALLNLWAFYEREARHLSQSKLRALCREHFLSYPRMREWHDLHRELAARVGERGAHPSPEPAPYDAVHRALLTGLLGHIGQRNERDRSYLGAREARFAIHPGSGLAKKPPPWLMAAELVETRRLYGRICARIEPEWVERAAGPRLKRTCFEPHWDRKRAAVMAYERTSLYGLTLCARRRVDFGSRDPATAREVFIRQALVAGDLDTDAPFFAHNARRIAQVSETAARARDRALGVDEGALFAFYDARIPQEIHDGRAFARWRRDAEASEPRLLFLGPNDLGALDAGPGAAPDLFPDTLEDSGAGPGLALAYRFQLGHAEDGVTATVPLHAMNALAPARFDWLVPGMLRDKADFLLKSLPKRYRKHATPTAQWAGRFADQVPPADTPLTDALAAFLKAHAGVEVPPEAWPPPDRLPDHLRMRFVVVDTGGNPVAAGRDLDALREQLGGAARADFARIPKDAFERTGLTAWDFGDLPETIPFGPGPRPALGHPALVASGSGVDLRLFDDAETARRHTFSGLLRLARLQLPKPLADPRHVPVPKAACLHYAPLGTCEALKADLLDGALAHLLFPEDGAEIRTRAAFEAGVERVRRGLGPALAEAARAVTDTLARRQELATALAAPGLRGAPESLADVKSHLGRLVFPGFAARTPYPRLLHLPRYLKALALRLERLQANPARDTKALAEAAPLWTAYFEALEQVGPQAPGMAEFRDLLEELRVSLFAQEVGTAQPVSVQRLTRRWKEIAP
jgi:ATP-dependent helicase HrpA